MAAFDKRVIKALQDLGYTIPERTEEWVETPNPQTVQDIQTLYVTDEKGGGSRRDECFIRYALKGIVERVHPLGSADITIGRGITVEVKTGHGWVVEPRFETREQLDAWMANRTNKLVRASHVAYLPKKAVGIYDEVYEFLFFSAVEFYNILDSFGKLQPKQNRGLWGIAMKPWLGREDGYTINNSLKVRAALMDELVNHGLTIWEFMTKFGLGNLHE